MTSFANKVTSIKAQIEKLQDEQYELLNSGFQDAVQTIRLVKEMAEENGGVFYEDLMADINDLFGTGITVEKLTSQIVERETALIESEAKARRMSAEVIELESRIQDWGTKYQLVVDERDRAIATISELNSDLERTVDEFEDKYSRCELNYRSAVDELSEARKRINQLEYEATLREAEVELLRQVNDVPATQEQLQVIEDEPELPPEVVAELYEEEMLYLDCSEDEIAAIKTEGSATDQDNLFEPVKESKVMLFVKGDIVELPDGRVGTIFHQEMLSNGEQICNITAPGGATNLHASSLRFIAKAEEPEVEVIQPSTKRPMSESEIQRIGGDILKLKTWAMIRAVCHDCPEALREAALAARTKTQIALIEKLPKMIADYINTSGIRQDLEWLPVQIKVQVEPLLEAPKFVGVN